MPGLRQKQLEKTEEDDTLKKMFALALQQYDWDGLSAMELRIFIRLLGQIERTRD